MTGTQTGPLPFVPYPPIHELAMVGDRRTAAMVAADGTVCWHCRPRYDATPIFGALLDLKGGFWRLGPKRRLFGRQAYVDGTAVLSTRWEMPDGVLELTDCMAWPEDEREPAQRHRHVILRRLRCLQGEAEVLHYVRPREDFTVPAAAELCDGWLRLQVPAHDLGLWSTHALALTDHCEGGRLETRLREGETIWAVLDNKDEAPGWTEQKAEAALEATLAYWRGFAGSLAAAGPAAAKIRFAGMVVQLNSYAPNGTLVAAPTTSLPERVPGTYNYDYRYCWVRDGALSIGLLAELGQTAPVGRFLDWLTARLNPDDGSNKEMPLQTLYRVDGAKEIFSSERPDVSGYRDCKPVRFGNPVFRIKEIDGFGFLADCAEKYVAHGGVLSEAQWRLIARSAEFVAAHWGQEDAGTWELMPFQHFTATKVMSWVALDRAIRLAERTGREAPSAWALARDEIHGDVLLHGWNAGLNSFVQRYGSEAMDATLLLIPLMGFLPPDDERVRATVERVEATLSMNGLLHRFNPMDTPGRAEEPMGEREGAFLMCTFWLARAWAMLGEPDKARMILARAETAFGSTGLISEAADSRQNPGLLGNVPLLFSQVEYARALMAIG